MVLRFGLLFGVIFSLVGCMDQYDPTDEWAKFNKERKTAHKELPKLTENGELPFSEDGEETASASFDIDEKYSTLCASCHGTAGQADTATAQVMNPKPRNLTDTDWQASVDDGHITKVLKEGGQSVGLSATMIGWSAILSDAEIEAMVQKVRSFGN